MLKKQVEFKELIEQRKSDLAAWKQVFNFTLLNAFYSIDVLYSRIESRDDIYLMRG